MQYNITKIIFPILLLFLCKEATGQIKIAGKIIDKTTGEPLIGANVIDKNETTNGNVTDFDGFFELSVSKVPTILNISYIGYSSIDYPLDVADQKLKIELAEDAVTIDLGVEIKGQRVSDKQKAAPLTIESLDAIAIKQTASTDFYNGLGSLKGVDLTTASLGFTVINTRGFNSTSPVRSLQTIDGVDNQSPGLNFSLGNFLGAPELDIQKVDLVVGASSAFYGPNAFNGVIAMETKNPFFHKGLSASVKVGERQMLSGGLRWADAFKNKSGNDFFAYKLNLYYLKAYDWVADNYNPITDSQNNRIFLNPEDNPGRWDAVNIYGDQYSTIHSGYADARAGLNRYFRDGYKEEDLVDYNTKNLKGGLALHFRTNPSKNYESPEIILATNYGSGTTVYQGDNRFSLKNIQFFQHRIELNKKDKYFLRAYMTHENSGDSYDPYFTAQKLLEASKSNEEWANAYEEWWVRNNLGAIFKKMKSLNYTFETFEIAQQWQIANADSLQYWHSKAAAYANLGSTTDEGQDYYKPGTARFDSLFNQIVSKKNNKVENGTKFFDKSALYHVHGQYKIDLEGFKDFIVGGNARLYTPNSEGTIFSDSFVTAENKFRKITNFEYGFYTGISKDISNLTVSLAARVDKNENFDFLFSPAGSIVYKPSENNYIRLSFSSAIRNPTLSDQYLNLKVGPALLLGNLTGYNNLISVDSFNLWRENPNTRLPKIIIDPIRPEKVKTFEVGYRTTLFENLFVDMSYYYNIYTDFIGYKIGIDLPFDTIQQLPPLGPLVVPRYGGIQAVRVAANSSEKVNSQGFAIGLNYYFFKYYAFNGNYSYNELTTNVKDEIVPAFNTPNNKYNVGISGRDLPIHWSNNTIGFNINYKWIEGFTFEGSPQFTGYVPSYDLLDAQISLNIPKKFLSLKAGASNVLNNKQFQTYGGPRIGRMAYISLTYEFKSKN